MASSSGDFTIPSVARANWLYYRNAVVTPFNLLKQQANWTHQLQNGGVVSAVSASAMANTNPPSKKVATAIAAVLATAEDPNDGPYRAYISIVSPFVNSAGDLVTTGGWIRRPDPRDPNWLAVSSFVKNNLATSPQAYYNRTQYHLSHDAFLYLGDIGPRQQVYALKFILAQHINPETGALIIDPATDQPVDGTFGLVTIQPSNAFLNGTGDLLLTPLSHVASQGFTNIVGALIFLEVILRFIEAQNVGGSYAYFGGITVPVRSEEYPDIPLTLPADQYAAWLKRNTAGTGLGIQRTTLKLQLVVPVAEDEVVSTTSGMLTVQPTQTSVTVGTVPIVPAAVAAEAGGSALSPGVIAALVVVGGIVIMIIVGLVIYFSMRRDPSAARAGVDFDADYYYGRRHQFSTSNVLGAH